MSGGVLYRFELQSLESGEAQVVVAGPFTSEQAAEFAQKLSFERVTRTRSAWVCDYGPEDEIEVEATDERWGVLCIAIMCLVGLALGLLSGSFMFY